MTTKIAGGFHTPDSWRFEWNLITVPNSITVWDADNVPQFSISGQIDQRKLEREKARFRKQHEGG